ncbi:hypothetical protein M758_1G117600 [Ceratodon purpureus]|nr:hypothetical protein M758_1G117600 [Ceratodon purpureus]
MWYQGRFRNTCATKSKDRYILPSRNLNLQRKQKYIQHNAARARSEGDGEEQRRGVERAELRRNRGRRRRRPAGASATEELCGGAGWEMGRNGEVMGG